MKPVIVIKSAKTNKGKVLAKFLAGVPKKHGVCYELKRCFFNATLDCSNNGMVLDAEALTKKQVDTMEAVFDLAKRYKKASYIGLYLLIDAEVIVKTEAVLAYHNSLAPKHYQLRYSISGNRMVILLDNKPVAHLEHHMYFAYMLEYYLILAGIVRLKNLDNRWVDIEEALGWSNTFYDVVPPKERDPDEFKKFFHVLDNLA